MNQDNDIKLNEKSNDFVRSYKVQQLKNEKKYEPYKRGVTNMGDKRMMIKRHGHKIWHKGDVERLPKHIEGYFVDKDRGLARGRLMLSIVLGFVIIAVSTLIIFGSNFVPELQVWGKFVSGFWRDTFNLIWSKFASSIMEDLNKAELNSGFKLFISRAGVEDYSFSIFMLGSALLGMALLSIGVLRDRNSNKPVTNTSSNNWGT